MQPTNLLGGKTVSPFSLLPSWMSLTIRRNIGHSEASSSIATIIKLVLAIENNLIPPTAGIVNLNPKSESSAFVAEKH